MNRPIATKEDLEIGKWLSAALDDINVCDAMKGDIINWMNSKEWPIVEENQLNIQWEKQIPERKENG